SLIETYEKRKEKSRSASKFSPSRVLFAVPNPISSQEAKSMNVKRITPVLFCNEIAPLLNFWVDGLGFAKTIEVPHGNKLGFVALQHDSTELMYQTFASLGDDMPLVLEAAKKGPTFLYIEVDDLDAVKA